MESIEPLSEPELVDGFESILKIFNPEKPLKITLQTDIAPELKLKKSKIALAQPLATVRSPRSAQWPTCDGRTRRSTRAARSRPTRR
mgnify:CR=1 FL=1